MNYIVLASTTESVSDNNIKLKVTIIAALISLTTSLIVTFVNNNRQRKSTYIETVTSNRLMWMTELKKLIDEFVCKTTLRNYTPIYYDLEDKSKFFEELNHLKNKIYLHLNYKGYIDQMIIDAIREILNRIEIIYEINELLKEKNTSNIMEYLLKNFSDQVFKDVIKQYDLSSEKLEDAIKNYYLGKDFPQEISSDFNSKMAEFNKNLRNSPKKIAKEVEEYHNKLFMYIQIYLKLEWNRVKDESNGKLNSLNNEDEYKIEVMERINDYDLKLNNYMEKLTTYLKCGNE
ncbi:MAG: hypothetical protein N4A63_04830 [Vallitalea sp.]|nr:hypothetical protein [Vallitalea sp.]